MVKTLCPLLIKVNHAKFANFNVTNMSFNAIRKNKILAKWRNHSAMTLNRHKKKKKYVIMASLKCETMGKLINRIPGECLLISSLAMSTSVFKALPGKVDIKRHTPGILCI